MIGSRRDSGLTSGRQSPAPSLGGRESGRDSGAESDGEAPKSESSGKAPVKKAERKKLPPKEEAPSSGGGSRRAPPPTIEELLKASRAKLSFDTHLTNRVFAAGTKIKLSCVVSGPDPNVRWIKNEQPIVYSPRCRNVSNQTGLCVLEITNCTIEDSGHYTCIVRNQECGIECSCQVQVYDTKASADLAPTFTRSLKG